MHLLFVLCTVRICVTSNIFSGATFDWTSSTDDVHLSLPKNVLQSNLTGGTKVKVNVTNKLVAPQRAKCYWQLHYLLDLKKTSTNLLPEAFFVL